MNVGDLLECVAAVCLVVAAWTFLGIPLALLALALFLIYESQCLADVPFRPWQKPEIDESVETEEEAEARLAAVAAGNRADTCMHVWKTKSFPTEDGGSENRVVCEKCPADRQTSEH